jgi:hypothetical protein
MRNSYKILVEITDEKKPLRRGIQREEESI